jgi:hypothetical protein
MIRLAASTTEIQYLWWKIEQGENIRWRGYRVKDSRRRREEEGGRGQENRPALRLILLWFGWIALAG